MRNECNILKFGLLCFPNKEKGRKKIRIGKGEPRETKSSNPQIIPNPPGTYTVLKALESLSLAHGNPSPKLYKMG